MFDHLTPRDVVSAYLPRNRPEGHEQEGIRPCLIVGIPHGVPRFPMVIIVPLTSKEGPWSKANPDLYPFIPAGTAGLPRDGIALIDQVRVLDRDRLIYCIGRLTEAEYRPIWDSLLRMFHYQS